jgi:hypothetical protein
MRKLAETGYQPQIAQINTDFINRRERRRRSFEFLVLSFELVAGREKNDIPRPFDFAQG